MQAKLPALGVKNPFATLLRGILVAAIALAAASNAVAVPQTVSLVGDPWPPYVNGELGEYADSGIAVDIVNRVFAQIDGADARFPLIPWKRALREVEYGQSDGIAILLKTEERERYMEYSVPLVTGYQLVWSIAGETGAVFEWDSIEDLHGKRVGVIEGYSYGDDIDAAIAAGAITPVRAPSVEHQFAMLVAGRIDLVLENDAVGYELARKYTDIDIRPARRPTNAETFYLGLSKKSPAVSLLPQINVAIIKLRDTGVIERLVRGEPVD